MKPKVIDLFAGVGGMSLGFEQMGFDVVFANEYDVSIADAYKINHPNTDMLVADITTVDFEKTFSRYFGEIDVIIGGHHVKDFRRRVREKQFMMNVISFLSLL